MAVSSSLALQHNKRYVKGKSSEFMLTAQRHMDYLECDCVHASSTNCKGLISEAAVNVEPEHLTSDNGPRLTCSDSCTW